MNTILQLSTLHRLYPVKLPPLELYTLMPYGE